MGIGAFAKMSVYVSAYGAMVVLGIATFASRLELSADLKSDDPLMLLAYLEMASYIALLALYIIGRLYPSLFPLRVAYERFIASGNKDVEFKSRTYFGFWMGIFHGLLFSMLASIDVFTLRIGPIIFHDVTGGDDYAVNVAVDFLIWICDLLGSNDVWTAAAAWWLSAFLYLFSLSVISLAVSLPMTQAMMKRFRHASTPGKA